MRIKYILPLFFVLCTPTYAEFNFGEQEPAPIVIGNPDDANQKKTSVPLDPVLTVDDPVPVKKKKKQTIKTEETQDEGEPLPKNTDPIRVGDGDDPLGKFLEQKGVVTIVPDKPNNKTKESKVKAVEADDKSQVVVNDAEEQAKLKDLVENSHVDGIWNIADNNMIIANQAQNAKPTLQFYSKGDIYGGAGKPQEVKKAEQQAMKEMDLTQFFNWGLIGMLVILLLGIIKLLLTFLGRKPS